MYIIKTNKTKEIYSPDKIHRHLHEACKGLNVDVISIIKDAQLKIFDGAKSSDIQDSLIKSAQEKISESSPDYEIAAGRLLNQKLRKQVYGQYEPKVFKTEIKNRINNNYYSKDLQCYSDEDLEFLGSKINYELDNELPYSSLNALVSKYLIKHNKIPIETPQEIFMLIPMSIFYNLKEPKRTQLILLGYKLLSQRKISLPTPIMNGARSPFKRFISCNVIDSGDSVKSLSLATSRIMQCTASKAGIGLNVSRIRGLGADIGKPSRVQHTGILPLIKTFEAATCALSQISRGGSSNLTIPFYHYEVELFCQLGDSKGSLENRARHTDQTIILNKWFLKKALNKEDIYLFHMNEVLDLYDALGHEDLFDELYSKYSKTVKSKHKKLINAFDLLKLFVYERSITGRVYFVFADNSIKGAFKDNTYVTNLCCLAGDTMIITNKGLKQIKDIKAGDIVLSYNEKTKQTEYKKVLNSLMTSPSREVIEIEYNNKRITCTPEHRILTKRGYIEAQYLNTNDEIINI